jgi:hypothetical protein
MTRRTIGAATLAPKPPCSTIASITYCGSHEPRRVLAGLALARTRLADDLDPCVVAKGAVRGSLAARHDAGEPVENRLVLGAERGAALYLRVESEQDVAELSSGSPTRGHEPQTLPEACRECRHSRTPRRIGELQGRDEGRRLDRRRGSHPHLGATLDRSGWSC